MFISNVCVYVFYSTRRIKLIIEFYSEFYRAIYRSFKAGFNKYRDIIYDTHAYQDLI